MDPGHFWFRGEIQVLESGAQSAATGEIGAEGVVVVFAGAEEVVVAFVALDWIGDCRVDWLYDPHWLAAGQEQGLGWSFFEQMPEKGQKDKTGGGLIASC